MGREAAGSTDATATVGSAVDAVDVSGALSAAACRDRNPANSLLLFFGVFLLVLSFLFELSFLSTM
ncbi:hypothetical protein [Frondihabitans cladoniiphilus]|uniref:Uncharacterized protein n=1 Tax=Frondihabitans cladoniiphilus TaxID=715785 RepID=A0ABP8VRR3_9MICO